jgi:hypothetical protein
MSAPNKALFLHVLKHLAASSPDGKAVQDADAQFREGFLTFGSETPDNSACVDEIGFGSLPPNPTGYASLLGFVLRRSGLVVSDILNEAEGCPIPEQVGREFPTLSQGEWDAILRLATMLVLAYEVNGHDIQSRGAEQ